MWHLLGEIAEEVIKLTVFAVFLGFLIFKLLTLFHRTHFLFVLFVCLNFASDLGV